MGHSFHILPKSRQTYDLRDISLESHVAVLTGTFDPVHYGHMEIVRSALKNNDFCFLAPHSLSQGKRPAPLEFRLELALNLLDDDRRMGILTHQGPAITSAYEFFSSLAHYHPVSYGRVCGADKIDSARSEGLNIPHLIASRNGIERSLPEGWQMMPVYQEISSTALREGQIPLPVEFSSYARAIAEHYPRADRSSLMPCAGESPRLYLPPDTLFA